MPGKIVSIDSLLSEVSAVFGHAAEKGREELNEEEIQYITRITKRMVKETKVQLGAITHLLPEELPDEIVVQITKRGPK